MAGNGLADDEPSAPRTSRVRWAIVTPPPCPHCQTPLDPTAIDRTREIATCGRCGRLVDLRAQPGQAQAPAAAPASTLRRARPAVPMPPGMTLATNLLGNELTLRRPWLRGKHWVMLMVFAGATATAVYFWATAGASTWLVIGTLFVLSWDYNLACMFLNRTEITANRQGITVRHGPLPSLFGFNRNVQRDDLKQLYAAKHGALFAVRAQRASQEAPLTLVAPLITAEQALFVEQQLERALGLADYAVEGELGTPVTAQGQPQPGAKSGAAVALAVPAIAGGAIALFAIAANTQVKGTLNANGALGTWSFQPDDCYSGQREGFGGVVLTSKTTPQRLVRVLNDPVRGTLLVVATQGQPNQIVDSTNCKRFHTKAERTNTNINDIWVVDGDVAVECAQIAGSVTFTGCH